MMKQKDKDVYVIKIASDMLVTDTSKDVTALAMAAKGGKVYSSVKGSGMGISTMLRALLVSDEEQSWELAKILIATPFVTCMSCHDEARKKEIFALIDSLYQQTYLDMTTD